MAAENQEDDLYNCEVCNIKFETAKTYFAHIYSVSHLQRVNAAENKLTSSSLPKADVVAASASGEKGQSGLVSFPQKSCDPVVNVSQGNSLEGSESLRWSASPAPGAFKDFAQREASNPFAQEKNLNAISCSGETDTKATPVHSKPVFLPSTSCLPTGAASQDAVARDQIGDMSRGTMEVKAPVSGKHGAVATEAVSLPLGMCAASGIPSAGNVSGASVVAGVAHQLSQIQPLGNTAMETVPGKSAVCQSLPSNSPSCLPLGKVSLAPFAASPAATVGSDGPAPVKDGRPSATVGSVPTVAVPCTKVKQDDDAGDDDDAILSEAINRAMAKDAAASSQHLTQPQMKLEDNSKKDAEMPKPEVDTKPSAIRPLMSSSSAPGPSGPKTTAIGGPLSAAGVQRTVPYTYDPLMPHVKVPLLPSPNTGFVSNSGYEGWSNSGAVVPLMEPPEPVFHHGPKVPLLRSPVSPFSSFPSTYPTPVSAYFSSPLLPTPVPLARAPLRPLMDPPVPAALGSRARPPRNWELENSSFDPKGVEVMDYHHGFSKNTGVRTPHTMHRENEHFVNLSLGHQMEPLMPGNWIARTKPKEEIKMNYACHICEVTCDDFFTHELHMAGLRHRQMAEGSFRKPVISSESKAHARVFKMEENAESAGHSPAFVTGLLDARRGPVSSASVTSTSSSSSSSGCFSELEKKLQVCAGPILGADYLTEYRYLDGRLEYTCDLCDVNLDSVFSVVEHISGTDHLLQFMCYNNPETYRMITGKAFNKDEVRQSAEKTIKTIGRQNRVRVKMESDDVSSDGRFSWIELKDSSIKPVASLPGHRLSNSYATVAPSRTTVAVDDMDSLLRTISLQACLLANRPPSQLRPLRRMDFLNALGKFEMQSSRDADICLQLANFLTIAVISFRRQILPSLNAVDVTKIEEKLKNLHKSARIVAAKVISSVSSTEVTRPQPGPSNERSV